MVGVAAGADSKAIVILGHGLTIAEEIELSAGIFVSPAIPKLDLGATAAGCRQFSDYAAALQGSEIATFAMRIEHNDGGKNLTGKAWNALWLFHLLSVACRSPCFSLYSVCDGDQPLFSAATPSPFVHPVADIHVATLPEIEWARRYSATFHELLDVPEFSAAIRCYGNAHLLPEQDVRIMLLWAGIEGLLSVDAELSRRLALYTALLLDGTPDEKAAYFDKVKKAYAVRSRAVHGGGLKKSKLEEGYRTAGQILIGLIAKCVEIGRVPSSSELDRLAVSTVVR
jgi:hypothetical protein